MLLMTRGCGWGWLWVCQATGVVCGGGFGVFGFTVSGLVKGGLGVVVL